MHQDRGRYLLLTAAAAALAFAAGWRLHTGEPVRAADSYSDVRFQLDDVGSGSALTLYYPSERTIYVYQGATTGNAALQCSYRFHLAQPGGVVRRESCAVPSLIR